MFISLSSCNHVLLRLTYTGGIYSDREVLDNNNKKACEAYWHVWNRTASFYWEDILALTTSLSSSSWGGSKSRLLSSWPSSSSRTQNLGFASIFLDQKNLSVLQFLAPYVANGHYALVSVWNTAHWIEYFVRYEILKALKNGSQKSSTRNFFAACDVEIWRWPEMKYGMA